MSQKRILSYLGLIFAFSWLLQLNAVFETNGIHSEAAEIWLVITMFIPSVVTLGFMILYRPLRSRLLWRPNSRVFGASLIAVMAPTAIAFGVLALIQYLGYGQSGWFGFSRSGVEISGGPWVLGAGHNSWGFFLVNVLLTGITFSMVNAIPAAAEELAWRGFLQSVLIEKLGAARGIALLGLIWSFWHLPALLAGYNHPENPVLGALVLFPIELIAVSFFLAWLTISSRSFIPAAIAHGAGNSIQEGVISNISLSVPAIYEDVATLFITISVGLVFWYLIVRQ